MYTPNAINTAGNIKIICGPSTPIKNSGILIKMLKYEDINNTKKLHRKLKRRDLLTVHLGMSEDTNNAAIIGTANDNK